MSNRGKKSRQNQILLWTIFAVVACVMLGSLWVVTEFDVSIMVMSLIMVLMAGSFFSMFSGLIHWYIEKKTNRCTCRTEGELLHIDIDEWRHFPNRRRRYQEIYYVVGYNVNGQEVVARVYKEYTEGLTTQIPLRTPCTVWYDPSAPDHALIAEDPSHLSIGSGYAAQWKVSAGILVASMILLFVCPFFMI